MSETVLRILIEELTTLRIVCKRCESSIDVVILKIEPGSKFLCPSCGGDLRRAIADPDDYSRLAEAIRNIRSIKSRDEAQIKSVEFVVPQKGEGDR